MFGQLAPSLGTAFYDDGIVHTHLRLDTKKAIRAGAPLCGAPARARGEAQPTDPHVCPVCRNRAQAWLQRQAQAAGA